MKVRMIFGTPVDGEDWRAGKEYDATAEQAERLVASGRAEPAESVKVAESEKEPAPKRSRKR